MYILFFFWLCLALAVVEFLLEQNESRERQVLCVFHTTVGHDLIKRTKKPSLGLFFDAQRRPRRRNGGRRVSIWSAVGQLHIRQK